jgi:RND family efflux transporter MFP subunit
MCVVSKFILFPGTIVALLLSSGCQTETSVTAASNDAGKGPGGEARQVRVVPVREEQVTRSIDATGTLAAQDQVALAMKVTGRLESITVDLGDRVKKGQVIATLDPTELRIGVQQAEAALQQARTRLGLMPEGSAERVIPERTATVRQAKATLDETKVNRDRAQQLFDAKLIARSDFDAAIAAYQVAEGRYQDAIEEIRNRQAVLAQRRSELELAKQQLADGVLRSPMDGAVFERQASAGQFLAAGTPIVTIVRLHPLRLRLPVPERAAAGVRIGQRVVIRLDQDRNEYSGRITRLSPAIDESNRTLLVEAEIPNERGTLRPGAFVRAELMLTGEHPALFVPASAIVTFAGLEKVISVQDGKSVEKTVTTGRKNEEKIEIAEGLKPGELVVVRPGNLTGGQPVVPVRQ